MASFSTAFGLCSVTDCKGLLGVSGDDEGCAIVTLGKSMVIRYRLSDQKQLNSWSSALSKLTSKVVWNAIDENYIGVFDNIYIKHWIKEESCLEKTKKHKFKNEIHEILLFSKGNILRKSECVVLFKNGATRNLESALNNSKEPMKEVIQPQEVIELADIIVVDKVKFLVMVTKFENKYRQCYCVQLEDESFLTTNSVEKIKLRRQGSSLLGFVVYTEDKENFLLTFWSDGFLYSLGLPVNSKNVGVGKFLGAINVISKNSEVSIQAVDGDRIAICGVDPSEDGAFLGIYNVKFGVIQTQTSFKMLSKPPRMWLVENTLVTVMGQRLVCVPFYLQTETLSGLVGSRALHEVVKMSSEVCAIIPTAVWDVGQKKVMPQRKKIKYPESIKDQLETYKSEGWSEFGICQALMTHLIEAKDISTLTWCLSNFTDIPEYHLVKMIQMALREESLNFSKSPAGKNLTKVNGKSYFINRVLTIPVDNYNLLKNLKEVFSFEDCFALIKYLTELFSEEGTNGDVNVDESTKVLDWAITLFDAFYQPMVLSRDSKVLESVIALKNVIENTVVLMEDLKKITPLILGLKGGKGVGKKTGRRKTYYVEWFRLYE